MVKPDSFGVKNGWEITVILPKASEEYGPISHYFLVVVPTEEATKDPGEFTIDEVFIALNYKVSFTFHLFIYFYCLMW